MTEKFYEIYYEDLADYPDQILAMAIIECRRTCRFFPTISEIREKADPILQKWTLENRSLLVENEYHKCHEHVYIDERRNPHCKIEENEPEKCKLARTGMCGKWQEEVYRQAESKWRNSGGSEQGGLPNHSQGKKNETEGHSGHKNGYSGKTIGGMVSDIAGKMRARR